MTKKHWIILTAALVCLALVVTVCVVCGVSFARRQKAEARAQQIASLQEPEFQPAYLEENQKKPDYQALHRLLVRDEYITWLFAGDSITHGCAHTNYWRNFAELFEQYIKTSANIRNRDMVINTAASSATTQDMETYFDAWIAGADADVAFLSFGTNDCTTDGMTPERFGQNLLHAIQFLRAQGAIPILQTPNVSSRQTELAPYLVQTRQIAAEQNVLLIDINQYWAENQEAAAIMMNDTLHPNAAGHITWCRFLLRALGMYDPASALAQLNYADAAYAYTPTQACTPISKNTAAIAALKPALYNQKPATWVFLGGAATQGLAHTPIAARNYVSHFNEIARWETTDTNMIYRCKTIVNAGRSGYLPADILRDYEALCGRFQPDVVVYLPEFSSADGTPLTHELLLEGSAVYQQVQTLARTVSAGGAVFVALTLPGLDDAMTKAAADMLRAACIGTNGVFIDTAELLSDGAWSADTADAQFALGRALSLSLYNPPRKSRMNTYK